MLDSFWWWLSVSFSQTVTFLFRSAEGGIRLSNGEGQSTAIASLQGTGSPWVYLYVGRGR